MVIELIAFLRNHQVWASGKSTVGTGAESKVFGRNIDISVGGIKVSPVRNIKPFWAVYVLTLLQGDIIFCDPLEGIVAIPGDMLEEVIALMPKLVAADDRIKEDVRRGQSVAHAFKKHRG
jgi:regulator of RNase E activity RraA